jgi:hypothetical protein
VAEDKLKGGKAADLATHADQLAAATAKPHDPLAGDSIVVDSNVLIGIEELMSPTMAWDKLPKHKQNGINYLRSRAKPPLPPLTGDPPGRNVESIIGTGHDLRAANPTLGETTPVGGLKPEGFERRVRRVQILMNS